MQCYICVVFYDLPAVKPQKPDIKTSCASNFYYKSYFVVKRNKPGQSTLSKEDITSLIDQLLPCFIFATVLLA